MGTFICCASAGVELSLRPAGDERMRPDDIRQFLRRRPFEPFRICLVDGTTYDVRHPDLVALGRSALEIGFPAAQLSVRLLHREVLVAPSAYQPAGAN